MTRRWRRLLLAGLVLAVVATGATPAARTAAVPLGFVVTAANGEGASVHPGRPCSDGGDGAYWHYDYGADLPANVFSALPGEVRVHLDLHSDIVRFPNTDGSYPDPPPGPTAYLLGTESHASLLNDRGTLKLRLASGDCESPTVDFDGSDASGDGTWQVAEGSGAYQGTTGSGTFSVDAEVNPGADNALRLEIANGSIQVRQPALGVAVVGTYWGQLGLDYLTRRVTVVYRITNTGLGDSFGAQLTAAQKVTNGVTLLSPGTRPLGNLAAGDSIDIELRWQLGLLQPCALVLLGCVFDTKLTVDLPDALDVHHSSAQTVRAKAPLLPPPL